MTMTVVAMVRMMMMMVVVGVLCDEKQCMQTGIDREMK